MDIDTQAGRNRLGDSVSPYLLQHADNPVHWFEWGEEAFAEARRLNRPILLSVGYSACHWCHVMAHESFEDPGTAALMNALFVNVKVDREERPDVDHVYMNALHALGQHGGWPLTMFLTPELKPFWGGTYFPDRPRHGQPAFSAVLQAVSDAFHNRPQDVERNTGALDAVLRERPAVAVGAAPSAALIRQVQQQTAARFDLQDGGLPGAPKFPQPGLVTGLLLADRLFGEIRAGQAGMVTIERIVRGGIHDHLGGGIARYAVDAAWLVPHFEKMLYDNAQFVEVLTLALTRGEEPLLARALEDAVDFLARDMRTTEGGFAASLDADSADPDGHMHEGWFYTWTPEEIRAALRSEGEALIAHFGVRAGGNFEGRSILNRLQHRGLTEDWPPGFEALRRRLLEQRATRPPPQRDDKLLADWNGLAITALARAGLARNRPDWIALARASFEAVHGTLFVGGRLRHAGRAGRIGEQGFAADHTGLGLAALALHEATGDGALVEIAATLAEALRERFADRRSGLLSMNEASSDLPFPPPQPTHDDAQPNANAQAIELYVRLAAATGDLAWTGEADRLIAAVLPLAERHPLAHGAFWNALTTRLVRVDLTLSGQPGAPDHEAMLAVVRSLPVPLRTLAMQDREGPAHLIVCDDIACSAPLDSPREVHERIASVFARQTESRNAG